MRKLGTKQRDVLKALLGHGMWSRGRCGWVWDTQSGTEKIMESLVKRGLVIKGVNERNGNPHIEYWPRRAACEKALAE